MAGEYTNGRDWHTSNAEQEDGVFPALREHNLKSLQVYVHPVEDREKVLETYTLTISYSSEETRGKRTVSGLEVEAPDGHRFTMGSTVASLVYLFRHITKLSHGLPQLSGASVSLQLLFALLTVDDQTMIRTRGQEHAFPWHCSTRMGRNRKSSLPALCPDPTGPSSSLLLKAGRRVRRSSRIFSSELKCKISFHSSALPRLPLTS